MRSMRSAAREHVGILERLVLALGHRQHHHLVRLAQVECRGADEIAHVLDHHHRILAGREMPERVADHVRVEVAALAGIDLHRRGARGADAIRVVGGLLVAFDHGDSQLPGEARDGLHEERGLARTGAGDQVQREDALRAEQAAVGIGLRVVSCQDVAFDRDGTFLSHARRMRRRESVVMAVRIGPAFDRHFAMSATDPSPRTSRGRWTRWCVCCAPVGSSSLWTGATTSDRSARLATMSLGSPRSAASFPGWDSRRSRHRSRVRRCRTTWLWWHPRGSRHRTPGGTRAGVPHQGRRAHPGTEPPHNVALASARP